MRSTSNSLGAWSLCLLIFLNGLTVPAQQSINPATQIRWPQVTGVVNPTSPTWPCTTANYGQPYTNTATNAQFVCGSSGWFSTSIAGSINPATQINWPNITGVTDPTGACTSTNYGQPYTNTTSNAEFVCGSAGWFAVGTGGGGATIRAAKQGTLLQQPDPGTVSNLGGPTGLTVDPVTGDNLVAPGSVTTPSLPGYHQNPYAQSNDRDNTIRITATPQDFCPDSGNGVRDDAPCVDAAIRAMAAFDTPGAVRQVVWQKTAANYQHLSTNYLRTLPYDFGDYHGSAGFATQAFANAHFVAGQLNSCTIVGGTKYTANARLPIQILDPQHLGSGATAYVTTDSVGTPSTTCTVTNVGMRYPSSGVIAKVIPLGGDGAAATVTLTSFNLATTATMTANGSGYSDGTGTHGTTQLVQIKIPAGLNCNGGPVVSFTAVVTNGSVTGVNISPSSQVCLYNGSPNGTVPLFFGDTISGGTAQATLLTPETPKNQACSVAIRSGVNLVGVGGPSIYSAYYFSSATSPTLDYPEVFCDPWGDQTGSLRFDLSSISGMSDHSTMPFIEGLEIYGIGGFGLAGYVSEGSFKHMKFHSGYAVKAAGFTIYNSELRSAAGETVFDDIFFNGITGIVAADNWSTRNPLTHAGGNLGGTQLWHGEFGGGIRAYGEAGGLVFNNIHYDTDFTQSRTDWITFLDVNYWKTANQPASWPTNSNNLLSNLGTSCYTTQTVVPRTTDGSQYGGISNVNYPYWNCYKPGVEGVVMVQPRYSTNAYAAQPVRISGVVGKGLSRPFYQGSPTFISVTDLNQPFDGGAPPDPYLPSGVKEAQIWLTNYIAPSGSISNILRNFTNISLQSSMYGLSYTTFGQTGSPNTNLDASVSLAFAGLDVPDQVPGAWNQINGMTGRQLNVVGGTGITVTPNGAVNPRTLTIATTAPTTFAGVVSLWTSCGTNFLKGDGTCAVPVGTVPGSNGLNKWNTSSWSLATYSDVVSLWTTCGSNYLKGDGTCGAGGTGVNPTSNGLNKWSTSVWALAAYADITGLWTGSGYMKTDGTAAVLPQYSHQWSAFDQWGLNSGSVGRYIGVPFYEVSATTLVAVEINMIQINGACSTSPVIDVMDLGTSPTTVYGSATSKRSTTTGITEGLYSDAGLSISLTAGHWYAFAYSGGVSGCSDTVTANASASVIQ